ncbi:MULTISPECIES: hypothetical protein [unclassified Marinovum]
MIRGLFDKASRGRLQAATVVLATLCVGTWLLAILQDPRPDPSPRLRAAELAAVLLVVQCGLVALLAQGSGAAVLRLAIAALAVPAPLWAVLYKAGAVSRWDVLTTQGAVLGWGLLVALLWHALAKRPAAGAVRLVAKTALAIALIVVSMRAWPIFPV